MRIDKFYRHMIRMYMYTCMNVEEKMLLVRCTDFRGCNVHKQGVWDSQMCPVYQGVLISEVSWSCNVHKQGVWDSQMCLSIKVF